MTALVARALGMSSHQLLESFVPAQADHLHGVIALRKELFGAGLYWDDTAYLTWRYRFGSVKRGRGDCWVLVLEGQVCGIVGTEQIELIRGEERIRAWAAMDIAVAPRYEGSGLGGWMNLRLCQAAGCALAIGSNGKSLNMVSRMFHRLPNRRSYILPIRLQRIIDKRIAVPALARSASVLGETLSSAWRNAAFLWGKRRFELRPIARFDNGITALLARAIDPREWQFSRTPEYLNWRLFDNPRVPYEVVCAYEDGTLVGYLASMTRVGRGEPRSVVLVDWMVDRLRFRPVFRALCGNAVKRAVAEGAELVTVTAYHKRTERLLRWYGFIPRLDPHETIGVNSSDEALLKTLLAAVPWFITEANADRDNL